MAGLIDLIEQKVLDHILTDPAWTPAATLYIALSTTTPDDTGASFTEPSGNAYARVSTAAADWSAASGTAPAQKTNTATKTFPAATGSWGTVTHFALFDASTAGNMYLWGALTTSKAIGNGDTASFGAGALILQMGDPGDSY